MIQSSNRIEHLQQRLSLTLSQAPLQNPFTAETIVVPTFAIARWLNLQFAQQQGVAANIDYPLPAAWLWRLAYRLIGSIPEVDPLEQEALSWQIFNRLPEFLPEPQFKTLRSYLKDDDAGIKRWRLAVQIAETFDRYQYYRPEMIRSWTQEVDASWQSVLWHALVKNMSSHRVQILSQMILHLQQQNGLDAIPERISLFAISGLPPLFIEVIHALAQHSRITLYQHCPTDQYWADLKTAKARSRIALTAPEQVDYYDVGNELLSSWGKKGQVFQDLLLEGNVDLGSEMESCHTSGTATLLQTIQQCIFALDDSLLQVQADDSLSIHLCHSPMRECQVLHDQIVSMLDRDASLNAEEIVVMIPKISDYAPYIEAVFRSDQNQTRPDLPWNISDISVANEQPLILAFLQLLKLPGSRFSRSQVVSFLEVDAICQRFDLDEKALQDIHAILDETRVYWGLDGQHKTNLGLPPTAQNTWQQARQRIFAGYGLGEVQYWNGIAPLPVDGTRAESFGRFCVLLDALEYWSVALSTATSAKNWQLRFNRLLVDFFSVPLEVESTLQLIREAIDQLKLGGQTQISPLLVNDYMTGLLSSREIHGRLYSGGITFCGMRPMRSVPFRVVCLLGMDDHAYPRRDRHLDFDLMKKHYIRGDPVCGDEDRYLMLETLLCTRQSLYISYSGRNLQDDSVCQPSVLVGELIDFIDARVATGDATVFSQQITHLHPMQAFAAENYLAETGGYDAYWCRIADQIDRPVARSLPVSWPEQTLSQPADPNRDISLSQLKSFLSHPIRYFFNHRLNIWPDNRSTVVDEEPFELGAYDQWLLTQRMTTELFTAAQSDYAVLVAEGFLPHGFGGRLSFERSRSRVDVFSPKLEPYQDVQFQACAFDHHFDDGLHLSGPVNAYYPGKGLLYYTTAHLKGRHLIALWLDHLALCASRQFSVDEKSVLISADHQWQFRPIAADRSLQQLQQYCDMFIQGMHRPLALFPAASFAYARKKGQARLSAATLQWQGNTFSNIPGDVDDPYIKLALRGVSGDPLLHAEFESCLETLYRFALDSVIE